MNSIDIIFGYNYMKEFETLKVRFDKDICWIRFNRDEYKNTINHQLVRECHNVIQRCILEHAKIVIFEGSKEYFCFGADLYESEDNKEIAEQLYDLWQNILYGQFISIAHVQGRVNAGGMGFVSVCDFVISDKNVTFGFSELIFGLYPSMVFPFLINRIGFAKAKHLVLTVKAISATEAKTCGLIDECGEDSEVLLKRYLSRLNKIPLNGVKNFKAYTSEIDININKSKQIAIQNNIMMFSDPVNIKRIRNFAEKGIYPWELKG